MNGHVHMCVRGIDFLLDFGTVPTVWSAMFSILFPLFNILERTEFSTHTIAYIFKNALWNRQLFFNRDLIWFLVLNTTFSNISAISWRPVIVREEAGVPGENHDHGQATGKLDHLRLRVECTLFVIYKAGREPTPYWWWACMSC